MVGVAMAGAAVLGAGASIYSSNQQSKAMKDAANRENAPWSAQQPYLRYGFEQGRSLYDQAVGRPMYDGPFDAGTNPNLDQGFNRMVDWSNNAGMSAGNDLAAAGRLGIGGFGQSLGNAQTLFNQAQADQTQNTINRAGQFADNPYVDGLVDASLRDVNRNLQLGLASNNANAVGTGNMNSTRAGVTEALLTQGAQDRAADISSQIRSGLYSQGLGLANTQIQQGFGNSLAANQQSLAGVATGAQMLGQGTTIQQGAIGAQIGVGQQQRDIANAGIRGELQKDAYQTNRDLDLLSKYMSIVGGRDWGGTNAAGVNYGTHDPLSSGVQGALGGAMMGYSLYNAFGGYGGVNGNQFMNTASPYSYGAGGYTGMGPFIA